MYRRYINVIGIFDEEYNQKHRNILKNTFKLRIINKRIQGAKANSAELIEVIRNT